MKTFNLFSSFLFFACISHAQQTTDSASRQASFKTYSKFDFVPGEKVIAFEDFSGGSIGDFPEGWNTNSSAEIVTIEGKPGHWLKFTKPGTFTPEFIDSLPDDFTFEFDLLHEIPMNGGDFLIGFAEIDDKSSISQIQGFVYSANNVSFEFNVANTGVNDGLSKYRNTKNSVAENGNFSQCQTLNDENNPAHISIWRQKERVRVYVNQEKVWDLPKVLAKEAKLNTVVFYMTYAEPGTQHFLGNLRLAVGAPDTKNKMLTQNKWVTHGILFDVNSDIIKPESYGTLKEMANLMKELPDLKVKIVGHTDADGSDAANLDLSKRRAASVKNMLATEFGIDASRMVSDGKGESEPVESNNTPAGKANNRRVEFIKS